MAKRLKEESLELPRSVRLLHTLEGNQGEIDCVAFHPRVAILASRLCRTAE
jgi:hypothetical protein